MVLFWICDENSVDNSGMFQLLLSSALHTIKAFSASQINPPLSRLEMHKELGGMQLEQCTPADQRDTPHHMMRSAIKTGDEEGRGNVQVDGIVFLSNQCTWCSSAFLEMLADRKWWMNSFLWLLVCVTFPLPIKLCLYYLMSCLTFSLPALFPSSLGESEQVALWGWAAWQV